MFPGLILSRGNPAVKHSVTYRSLFASWFLLLSAAGVSRADNWPQWRGPQNDGVCKETSLPTEWSATKNIVWKLPMPGSAGSTPISWEDRIFLTSEAETDVTLICVSTEGRVLWQRK